jgi:membrane fusion protein (multidrug efflux system)
LFLLLSPVGAGIDQVVAGDLVLTGELHAAEADRMAAPVTEADELQLKWLIAEGSQVEVGQPVARFDPGRLQENLDSQEDRLAELLQQQVLKQTDATLKRLDLELELARAETARAIAGLEAAVPEETLKGIEYRKRQLELERKKRAEDAARFALSTEEDSRIAAKVATSLELGQVRDDIARFERELNSLELRAGSSGIVVHGSHPWEGRKFRAGDNIQPTWLVATIPELHTLEVVAWAAEPDVPRIRTGQGAILYLDAYPSRVFHGRVVALGLGGEIRRLWGKSPYYSVRIALDTVDIQIMKPGMSVRAVLEDLQ